MKGWSVLCGSKNLYKEPTGEYQLLSQEDDNHAYVVGEGQITQPVWKKLLVWEE